ncbi:SH3 domain-containing protein [Massariosphaeria phaeospora]|uniref:SH3 domain-containing protein n=1 Tax=Massariosphaeria phaeospora TaxID=100035 RepID=A0A7C8I475_9PLEO|nr:SH3 domain-containing protein [Massariosphaeria phaeospora]
MKLGIKGVADIVVESESAVLNLPGSRERREALNADHSSMCKIGTKGDMYEGVMGKLRDMVDDALDEFEGKQGAAGQTFLSPMSPARGRSTSPAFSTHIRTPSRHSPAVTEDVPRSIASPPAPPKPLALPPASTIARALWAYSGPDSNDLPLKEGDMITDIQKIDPEWWQGTNPRGQTGIFPRTYVEELFRGEAPSEYNPWERPAAPAHSISVPTPKQEEPVLARASHSESDLVEQPMQIVHSALCDHCKQQIKGIRHKCETCLDWDYCSGCVSFPPPRFTFGL